MDWLVWRTLAWTALSRGSPRISPRSQRLPVTKLSPVGKRITVRLQWFWQKGQGSFWVWV